MFSYLKSKPSYIFIKVKFSKIQMNSTMCIALDVDGYLRTWGKSELGVLGLGYKLKDIKEPTKLHPLRYIQEYSVSESHAVAVNTRGEVFSWGTGKYGELCLEATIYSPYPSPMNNVKHYEKVFCGELITCFIDSNGQFSYFGIVIRILEGQHQSITLRNLLLNESTNNPETMFIEKTIVELEKIKFSYVCLANGFIALLSDKGRVFTLDYSDNITSLFSNHPLRSISTSNNTLFGVSNDKLEEQYFLIKWSVNFDKGKITSESWQTTLYGISDQEFKMLDSRNMEIILFMQLSSNKLNVTSNLISQNGKNITDNNMSIDLIQESKYNQMNILKYIASYDDSYNVRYKRNNKLLDNVKVHSNRLARSTINVIPIRKSQLLSQSDNSSIIDTLYVDEDMENKIHSFIHTDANVEVSPFYKKLNENDSNSKKQSRKLSKLSLTQHKRSKSSNYVTQEENEDLKSPSSMQYMEKSSIKNDENLSTARNIEKLKEQLKGNDRYSDPYVIPFDGTASFGKNLSARSFNRNTKLKKKKLNVKIDEKSFEQSDGEISINDNKFNPCNESKEVSKMFESSKMTSNENVRNSRLGIMKTLSPNHSDLESTENKNRKIVTFNTKDVQKNVLELEHNSRNKYYENAINHAIMNSDIGTNDDVSLLNKLSKLENNEEDFFTDNIRNDRTKNLILNPLNSLGDPCKENAELTNYESLTFQKMKKHSRPESKNENAVEDESMTRKLDFQKFETPLAENSLSYTQDENSELDKFRTKRSSLLSINMDEALNRKSLRIKNTIDGIKICSDFYKSHRNETLNFVFKFVFLRYHVPSGDDKADFDSLSKEEIRSNNCYISKMLIRILSQNLKKVKPLFYRTFINNLGDLYQSIVSRVFIKYLVLRLQSRQIITSFKILDSVKLKHYLRISKLILITRLIYLRNVFNLDEFNYRIRITSIKKGYIRDFISLICSKELKIFKLRFLQGLYFLSLLNQIRESLSSSMNKLHSSIVSRTRHSCFQDIKSLAIAIRKSEFNIVSLIDSINSISLPLKEYFFKYTYNEYIRSKSLLRVFLIKSRSVIGTLRTTYERFKRNCESENEYFAFKIRISKVFKTLKHRENLRVYKFFIIWKSAYEAVLKKRMNIKYNVINDIQAKEKYLCKLPESKLLKIKNYLVEYVKSQLYFSKLIFITKFKLFAKLRLMEFLANAIFKFQASSSFDKLKQKMLYDHMIMNDQEYVNKILQRQDKARANESKIKISLSKSNVKAPKLCDNYDFPLQSKAFNKSISTQVPKHLMNNHLKNNMKLKTSPLKKQVLPPKYQVKGQGAKSNKELNNNLNLKTSKNSHLAIKTNVSSELKRKDHSQLALNLSTSSNNKNILSYSHRSNEKVKAKNNQNSKIINSSIKTERTSKKPSRKNPTPKIFTDSPKERDKNLKFEQVGKLNKSFLSGSESNLKPFLVGDLIDRKKEAERLKSTSQKLVLEMLQSKLESFVLNFKIYILRHSLLKVARLRSNTLKKYSMKIVFRIVKRRVLFLKIKFFKQGIFVNIVLKKYIEDYMNSTSATIQLTYTNKECN